MSDPKNSEIIHSRVWGLTGGIAAGKSTAALAFQALGIPVVDADAVARELLAEGGRAYASVQLRFGTTDRAKLREIIFRDPKARRDLEAILHPLIQIESESRLRQLANVEMGPIIYEAALLVETKRYRSFAGLIVIEAPIEDRVRRIVARDGGTAEQARAVIAAQLSDADRRAVATHVITNNGTAEDLRIKIGQLATELRNRASAAVTSEPEL